MDEQPSGSAGGTGVAGPGDALTEATGRRAALRSLGAAGVALVAARGLHDAAAKDQKHGGGKGHKTQKPGKRQDGERKPGVTAQAPPPGTPPTQGPTGPSGPTGPTGPQGARGLQGVTGPEGPRGADSQVTGPTGPAGAVSGGGIAFDEVAGGQGTNSPSFTDLATTGPAVTVTVPASGRVLVTLSAELFVRNVGGAIMSFKSTGGSGDVDPEESRSIFSFFSYFDPDFNLELIFDLGVSASATIPLSGLSPGSHTFTAKYLSLTGDFVSFRYRRLIVTPLP